MYGGRPDSLHELRRRRVLGVAAIAAVLLVAFALNGWQTTPIWALFEDNEGTFAAGDPFNEWVYAVCDGEEQQVTVLRDGRLEGTKALDSLRSVRFPNWCSDLPTVDNPELESWQSQLAGFQALAASTASAAPLLDAAERLPVSSIYLKPLSEWIRDEQHALSFLDTVAVRPMRLDHPNSAIERARQNYFSDLVARALDVAVHGDVTAERLERWLSSRQIASSGETIAKLAQLDDLTDAARVMVLQRLDAIRADQRSDVYLSVAPELVKSPEHAALLTEKLRLLPRERKLGAAQQLLARPDTSAEFPIVLLSSLRRTFSGADARLQLYNAIADRIHERPDATALLTRHLKDMDDMQRRMAASYLLGLDAPGETAFAMSLLGAFADLHPMSRPKFVYALLQSPQFAERSVQEACLLAIQLQVRGQAKTELLTAMARHPSLDDALQSRIAAELGRDGPAGGISL